MDPSKSPTGSTKRHSRNISYARPRRSTRGPLDAADDPLSDPPKSPAEAASLSDATSTASQSAELPPPTSSEPDNREKIPPNVDLRFLKDASNYHQIGTEDIPPPFLDSPNQPPPDTSLPELLQHGHFRRAAGTALIELSRCPADDAIRIFQLLYTRLACLVLISRVDLASVEAASLTDFLARNAPGAEAVAPLIPWELRILLVRLQSIAAADGGRRGIMALYALSAEVRSHIKDAREASNGSEMRIWADRLRDLGLRVADTLVEMGELETATRHLDSLVDVDGDELAYRKALLRLRVGDVSGTRRCIDRIENTTHSASLNALLEVADGNFSNASETLRSLVEENSDDALLTSNFAVGLLYTGNIAQARQIFERLAEHVSAFPGLLFNLGTVYELCTEYALDRKTNLSQNMASKPPNPASGGWERTTFDFKL